MQALHQITHIPSFPKLGLTVVSWGGGDEECNQEWRATQAWFSIGIHRTERGCLGPLLSSTQETLGWHSWSLPRAFSRLLVFLPNCFSRLAQLSSHQNLEVSSYTVPSLFLSMNLQSFRSSCRTLGKLGNFYEPPCQDQCQVVKVVT